MTKEIDIDKLIDTNQRLLLILGVATSIIHNAILKDTKDESWRKWFFQALENVVYKNKPLPPMP